MSVFIHPSAEVATTRIGDGTRIWQFVVILEHAEIGREVNICSHCFIENEVRIGDRSTIKSGVQLWDGIELGEDVFVGPNVSFGNDRFPRSRQYRSEPLRTLIGKGASIGGGAAILPGVVVGEHAMIGAGAVVTRDVPSFAIIVGNPGVIVGYAGATHTEIPAAPESAGAQPRRVRTGAGDSEVYELPKFRDLRGSLAVTELEKDLPFAARRCFWVYAVPTREVRGEHAHRECHQFLVCVAGQVSVLLDDGRNRAEVELDSPALGLHIPPMVWSAQFNYSPDAVLIVLASHAYDKDDYIRDYESFRQLKGDR